MMQMGYSMMFPHLCNTYSSIGDVLHVPKQILADLFFKTYLATCYIPESLSMRVALETGFFLKFLRVVFCSPHPQKNS